MRISLVSLCHMATADLPVHCLLDDFAGKWTFHLGEVAKVGAQTSQVPDFSKHMGQSYCGRVSPNTNQQNLDLLEDPASHVSPVTHLEAELTMHQDTSEIDGVSAHPLQVVSKDGRGSWTSVYDEGFEARVPHGDGHVNLFAFARYECAPGSGHCGRSGDMETEHGKLEGYFSTCGQTHVGWYTQLDQGGQIAGYGCWYGEKVDTDARDLATSFVALMPQQPPTPSLLESNTKHTNRNRAKTRSRVVYHRSNFQAGKLPKDMQSLLNNAAEDLNSVKRNRNLRAKKGSRAAISAGGALFQSAAQSADDKSEACNIDTIAGGENAGVLKNLPKDFDLRDQFKGQWNQEIQDQGECGSCYAVAETYALQSRINLETCRMGKCANIRLSTQSNLDCGYYTQSCEGGFPFLVARNAHDFGVPLDKCNHYSGVEGTPGTTCPAHCYSNHSELWFTKDYGYVGGFYGKCSETRLMQTIFKNGPTAVAFQVPDSLGYVMDDSVQPGGSRTFWHSRAHNDTTSVEVHFSAPKEILAQVKLAVAGSSFAQVGSNSGLAGCLGQYLSPSLEQTGEDGVIVVDGRKLDTNFSDTFKSCLTGGRGSFLQTAGSYSASDIKVQHLADLSRNSWEYTDHAVVAVGWGEKNSVPYWVIRNSWGRYFGDEGYVLIRRGQNDMGIESQAVFSAPDFSRGAGLAFAQSLKAQ
mmetsp:Transcript_15188/g.33546  ORF Transcript_15188/g.33546 Transcript_15188/m.33546 type:complete len:694 (+) Transcript_15188:87-2168(+)